MKLRRITVALMLCAMLITSACASADVIKDEIVYARLSPGGAPESVIVVNAFETGGETHITDFGDYVSVAGLSGISDLKYSGGEAAITAGGGRAYYQGALENAALPWNVAIGYTLDGNEVSPEQLAGATGSMGLNIDVKNNPLCEKPFAKSYMLQISVTLPADRFLAVKAEGASVSISGGSLLVTFMLLPGKEGSFSLTADAQNAEIEPITFAGVPMGFDLSDIDMSALTMQLLPLKMGVKSLSGGVGQVSGGLESASAGFTEWLAGFDAFSKGLGEYLSGVKATADGAAMLKQSAEQLDTALNQLFDGLSIVPAYQQSVTALKTGWGAFYAGLGQALDGTAALGTATEGLTTAMDGLKTGADGISTGLTGLKDGAKQAADGMSQLDTQLGAMDLGAAAKDAVSKMTGGEHAPISFVSEKNGAANVQFVLMTGAIRVPSEPPVETPKPDRGLWDRIVDLFR